MSQITTTGYYGSGWWWYRPLGGKITSVSNEGNLITVNLCISNVSMTGNGRVFI